MPVVDPNLQKEKMSQDANVSIKHSTSLKKTTLKRTLEVSHAKEREARTSMDGTHLLAVLPFQTKITHFKVTVRRIMRTKLDLI